MNCAELEILLCDYVDGTLDAARKREVEQHLSGCSGCAELARDAAAAVAFIERAAPVEPPPELLTHLVFDLTARVQQAGGRHGKLRRFFGRLVDPVLQPRFAMGMAMTILSFSMLLRFAGVEVRQLSPSDLNPVEITQAVEDRVQRAWTRAVKFYESLRLVYEVRTRWRELTAREEEEERRTSPPAQEETPAGARSGASGPAGERESRP